jgi:large subunit ribosomal protein L23
VEEAMTTIYDVLRRPIITEKSNYQNSELHQFVFEVALDANKAMVKDAVETLFDVDVLRVNIIVMPAKKKRNLRSRQMVSRRSAYKKAIVTLAPGDSIDVFEGVK